MRRMLLLAAAAAAFLAVPASAEPAIDTCDSDDYTVARVEALNIEVAHLCTDEDPKQLIPSIHCGDLCDPLGPIGTR